MPVTKPILTIDRLLKETAAFSEVESTYAEPSLFGVTDGKAVGTYLEHKFVAHLLDTYEFMGGNSALGIDLPSVNTDIKVTSVKQPQSSCPFRSARQKVYGLGYHLVVFVYNKTDNQETRTSCLNMKHTIFVEADRTGDYQMTRRISETLAGGGNVEDLIALMLDRNLPLDEIQAQSLAEEILAKPHSKDFSQSRMRFSGGSNMAMR